MQREVRMQYEFSIQRLKEALRAPVLVAALLLPPPAHAADAGPVATAQPDIAARPAVTQDGGEGILPRPQQTRHVVGLVVQPLAVIGPTRPEQLVTDPVAVEAHLVEPQRRRGEIRPAHRPFGVESPAQKRARRQDQVEPAYAWLPSAVVGVNSP